MIALKNIVKCFGGEPVLKLPYCGFEEGGCHALMGANGSGKTTLLRILAGTLQQDEGTLAGLPAAVGYLPQKPYPFAFSVLKNMMLTGATETEALAALERVGLSSLAEKRGDKLSGGETQRLCMARLFVRNCQLLLLDEPTSAADIAGAELVEHALTDYQKDTGCTIIFATHSPAQALRLGSEVAVLHGGALIEQGSVAEVLKNQKTQQLADFLTHWRC